MYINLLILPSKIQLVHFDRRIKKNTPTRIKEEIGKFSDDIYSTFKQK